MVDIGGEVVVKGKNATGDLWRIGINKPYDDSLAVKQDIQTILNLTDVGMATSGNYRNYYYKDGKSMLIQSTPEQDIRYNTAFYLLQWLQKTV